VSAFTQKRKKIPYTVQDMGLILIVPWRGIALFKGSHPAVSSKSGIPAMEKFRGVSAAVKRLIRIFSRGSCRAFLRNTGLCRKLDAFSDIFVFAYPAVLVPRLTLTKLETLE
jgi:hypothetical protein